MALYGAPYLIGVRRGAPTEADLEIRHDVPSEGVLHERSPSKHVYESDEEPAESSPETVIAEEPPLTHEAFVATHAEDLSRIISIVGRRLFDELLVDAEPEIRESFRELEDDPVAAIRQIKQYVTHAPQWTNKGTPAVLAGHLDKIIEDYERMTASTDTYIAQSAEIHASSDVAIDAVRIATRDRVTKSLNELEFYEREFGVLTHAVATRVDDFEFVDTEGMPSDTEPAATQPGDTVLRVEDYIQPASRAYILYLIVGHEGIADDSPLVHAQQVLLRGPEAEEFGAAQPEVFRLMSNMFERTPWTGMLDDTDTVMWDVIARALDVATKSKFASDYGSSLNVLSEDVYMDDAGRFVNPDLEGDQGVEGSNDDKVLAAMYVLEPLTVGYTGSPLELARFSLGVTIATMIGVDIPSGLIDPYIEQGRSYRMRTGAGWLDPYMDTIRWTLTVYLFIGIIFQILGYLTARLTRALSPAFDALRQLPPSIAEVPPYVDEYLMTRFRGFLATPDTYGMEAIRECIAYPLGREEGGRAVPHGQHGFLWASAFTNACLGLVAFWNQLKHQWRHAYGYIREQLNSIPDAANSTKPIAIAVLQQNASLIMQMLGFPSYNPIRRVIPRGRVVDLEWRTESIEFESDYPSLQNIIYALIGRPDGPITNAQLSTTIEIVRIMFGLHTFYVAYDSLALVCQQLYRMDNPPGEETLSDMPDLPGCTQFGHRYLKMPLPEPDDAGRPVYSTAIKEPELLYTWLSGEDTPVQNVTTYYEVDPAMFARYIVALLSIGVKERVPADDPWYTMLMTDDGSDAAIRPPALFANANYIRATSIGHGDMYAIDGQVLTSTDWMRAFCLRCPSIVYPRVLHLVEHAVAHPLTPSMNALKGLVHDLWRDCMYRSAPPVEPTWEHMWRTSQLPAERQEPLNYDRAWDDLRLGAEVCEMHNLAYPWKWIFRQPGVPIPRDDGFVVKIRCADYTLDARIIARNKRVKSIAYGDRSIRLAKGKDGLGLQGFNAVITFTVPLAREPEYEREEGWLASLSTRTRSIASEIVAAVAAPAATVALITWRHGLVRGSTARHAVARAWGQRGEYHYRTGYATGAMQIPAVERVAVMGFLAATGYTFYLVVRGRTVAGRYQNERVFRKFGRYIANMWRHGWRLFMATACVAGTMFVGGTLYEGRAVITTGGTRQEDLRAETGIAQERLIETLRYITGTGDLDRIMKSSTYTLWQAAAETRADIAVLPPTEHVPVAARLLGTTIHYLAGVPMLMPSFVVDALRGQKCVISSSFGMTEYWIDRQRIDNTLVENADYLRASMFLANRYGRAAVLVGLWFLVGVRVARVIGTWRRVPSSAPEPRTLDAMVRLVGPDTTPVVARLAGQEAVEHYPDTVIATALNDYRTGGWVHVDAPLVSWRRMREDYYMRSIGAWGVVSTAVALEMASFGAGYFFNSDWSSMSVWSLAKQIVYSELLSGFVSVYISTQREEGGAGITTAGVAAGAIVLSPLIAALCFRWYTAFASRQSVDMAAATVYELSSDVIMSGAVGSAAFLPQIADVIGAAQGPSVDPGASALLSARTASFSKRAYAAQHAVVFAAYYYLLGLATYDPTEIELYDYALVNRRWVVTNSRTGAPVDLAAYWGAHNQLPPPSFLGRGLTLRHRPSDPLAFRTVTLPPR